MHSIPSLDLMSVTCSICQRLNQLAEGRYYNPFERVWVGSEEKRPLAEKITDSRREILKELIPQMFEVLHRIARVSCDYVKRRRWSSPRFDSSKR